MIMVIALSAAFLVIAAIPLVFLRPQWVFYLYLFSSTFGVAWFQHVGTAGNLGLPKCWEPADFLAWLTLLAALQVQKPAGFPSNAMKKCLIVIAVLGAFNLMLGLGVYHYRNVFFFSRELHFIPAMLFASRYFTDTRRVQGFLRFCVVVVLLMLVVHILIRFGLYRIPGTRRSIEGGQLTSERGGSALAPELYLLLASVAIARIVAKRGSLPFAILCVLSALFGIALSETRSIYGGIVAIGFTSLILMRGRLNVAFVYGVAGVLVFAAAQAAGFDVLYRLRTRAGKGEVRPLKLADMSYRVDELQSMSQEYWREPYLLLTGRGTGAVHRISAAYTETPWRGYYHIEPLVWLDRFGLIGGATMVTLILLCLKRCRQMAKSGVPWLVLCSALGLLWLVGYSVGGIANPTFMRAHGGLAFCLFPIMANWAGVPEGRPGEEPAR